MLYATVRNRKVSVKKPNVVPCNGKNVDFLTLDLDDDWKDAASIVCTFTNDYFEEKTQKKTTVTTVTTQTKTQTENPENILSSKTTTDVTVTYADAAEDEEENENTETSKTTDTVEDDDTTTTTTTEVKTTVKVVRTAEARSESKDVLHTKGEAVKIPAACVKHEGQLSVCLTGYSLVVEKPEDIGEDTKVLTMALPDSFWELVENGEPEWDVGDDDTASLYQSALAAVDEAVAAAKRAEDVASVLEQSKAAGAFDGTDGVTPSITVGTVETVDADEPAQVTRSGTATDVRLNFKIPRGRQGDNTPVKGVDYFTDEDIDQMVEATLAALPNFEAEVF